LRLRSQPMRILTRAVRRTTSRPGQSAFAMLRVSAVLILNAWMDRACWHMHTILRIVLKTPGFIKRDGDGDLKV